MQITPDRAAFLELADRMPIVPVRVEVLGDRDTAVTVFEKLAGDGPAFLLESVEGGERWARWSFVGWDPIFTMQATGGTTAIHGLDVEVPEGDPLVVLEAVLDRFRMPEMPDLPPLHGGLVGYLSYDAVRYVERLPNAPLDDRQLPEMAFQAVGSMAALDRFGQTITLIRNAVVGDNPEAAYDEAVNHLERAVAALGGASETQARALPDFSVRPDASASMTQEEYEEAVRSAIRYIEAGDAFQIVPSIRLEVPFEGDPFAVYRALRLLNPSPYMFFVRQPDVVVAGSSPELMVRARDGRVFSRPIAGTRPRGSTPETDRQLEEELLADPKERAEHVMLIDLARNDVGRVSEFGTVSVDDLMVIERYSHVMHIVSGVSGRLRDGVGPIDVLRATFPHGTVSGAPKVRAMEIIDELEPVARGPYAGAVGYLDFSGNLDTAIALRTMVCADGKAWVQAGAGVVADSDPSAEYRECLAKAAAVLDAIGGADRV